MLAIEVSLMRLLSSLLLKLLRFLLLDVLERRFSSVELVLRLGHSAKHPFPCALRLTRHR